jgi:serine/threonine protein kinase
MIGKKILNYEIKSLLGEGGMGNVYLAEHVQLGRKVAIKMLHPRLASNEGLRKRFKNEASAMAHLQHPNIVGLLDYVESDDGLFLIMEYVEGEELDVHIREVSGPIAEEKAVSLMGEILDAFDYAHKQGVVHRDIKPSNILMTKDEKIKILDFGIAKMMDDDKSMTKTGTQMGTVLYMSPEQVKGEKVDNRTDIYSLGVTFFQMLTGQAPYSGDTTEYEVYTQIVKEPLPRAGSIYPGVSERMETIIAKATEKEKQNRFQDCSEMKSSFTGDVQFAKVQDTGNSKVSLANDTLEKVPRLKILNSLYLQLESPARFHISPQLPVNKVIRFLKEIYGANVNDFVSTYGKVQMLFDNSGWKSGRSGILITTDVIVIAESKNKRIARKWNQVSKLLLVKMPENQGVAIKVVWVKDGEDKESVIKLTNMTQKIVNDLFKIFTAFNEHSK